MLRFLAFLLILFIGACADNEEMGPLRVDMIGDGTTFDNPIAALPSPSDAVLLEATAQGLVRFDGEGQIEPAIAQRWIVLDEGQTYVFRLNDLTWNDGTAVTAGQIAQRLRNASREGSPSHLASQLADITAINAVTPQVIEINLTRPRLDFLQLLASPDLAIFVEGSGLGPFEIARDEEGDEGFFRLIPRREPPEEMDGELAELPPLSPNETVDLRFGAAPIAVERFADGLTDLLIGGDWTTLIYADASDVDAGRIQIDPVEGLFGLAIVEQNGFLADPQNREILSLAINRTQLAEYLGGDRAEPRLSILPSEAEGLTEPVGPPWVNSAMRLRRSFARQVVASWQSNNGSVEPLRIALPDNTGSRIIFSVLRTNWAAIGITVERVGWDEDADLRLLDRVAASESALWYLEQFNCANALPCSEEYAEALEAVHDAQSDRVRTIRIAEAANELQRITPFIPLLRPIRWSLVSPRIANFTPNRFASHPFDTLTPSS